MSQAYDLYLKQDKYPDAMRVALRVNDRERIEQCFAATPDPLEKQQLAFLLARQVQYKRPIYTEWLLSRSILAEIPARGQGILSCITLCVFVCRLCSEQP